MFALREIGICQEGAVESVAKRGSRVKSEELLPAAARYLPFHRISYRHQALSNAVVLTGDALPISSFDHFNRTDGILSGASKPAKASSVRAFSILSLTWALILILSKKSGNASGEMPRY